MCPEVLTLTSKNECGIRNTARYKQISILLCWATWNTALEPTRPRVYKNKLKRGYEIIFTTAELLTGVKFTVLKVLTAFVLPVVVHSSSKYKYIDNFEVSSRIILQDSLQSFSPNFLLNIFMSNWAKLLHFQPYLICVKCLAKEKDSTLELPTASSVTKGILHREN